MRVVPVRTGPCPVARSGRLPRRPQREQRGRHHHGRSSRADASAAPAPDGPEGVEASAGQQPPDVRSEPLRALEDGTGTAGRRETHWLLRPMAPRSTLVRGPCRGHRPGAHRRERDAGRRMGAAPADARRPAGTGGAGRGPGARGARPRPERPAGPGHFPPGDREGSFVPAVTEAPLDHAEGCAGDRGPGSAWCHDLWPVDGSSSAGKSSNRRRRPSPHGSNVLRASDEMSSSSSVTGCWSAAPGVAARRGPDRRPGVWPPSRWSVRAGSPVPSGPGRLWP